MRETSMGYPGGEHVTGLRFARLEEMWRRVVRSPLYQRDFDRDAFFPIWTRHWWVIAWWRVAGPVFHWMTSTAHIWWVPTEGGYYTDGRFVSRRQWRVLWIGRLRDLAALNARAERRREEEQRIARQDALFRDLLRRYPDVFDAMLRERDLPLLRPGNPQ